mgnify:CR=1 FL=1
MMKDFNYQQGQLFCEQVALADIAEQFGTPAYVYSRAAFTRHYLEYQQALGDQPGMICYAVKANSNIAVLNVLAKLGAGFDCGRNFQAGVVLNFWPFLPGAGTGIAARADGTQKPPT